MRMLLRYTTNYFRNAVNLVRVVAYLKACPRRASVLPGDRVVLQSLAAYASRAVGPIPQRCAVLAETAWLGAFAAIAP